MTSVQVGAILAGKYRVERVLGQGGMGVVVAATHLQLRQLVALKFLLPGMLDRGEGVERFLREARTAVQIRSEHVARILDVGTLETGAPYIVMEYLEGTDLAALVSEHGPLPIPIAVDYVLQCCEAIAESHSLDIVHRDLKPANLFLTRRRDGSALVKVLDFGISKVVHRLSDGTDAGRLTATAAVVGSPLYMSPEQITSSRDVDFRTDIWSLGVILHELVAARPPYMADTAPALMVAIAVNPPAPLRAHRSDVPAELEAVVLRCLQKDRNSRYADVGELALALAPFAGIGGVPAAEKVRRVLGTSSGAGAQGSVAASAHVLQASGAPVLNATATADTGAAWAGTGSVLRKRHRGRWLALGLAPVVLAGVAIFGLRSWSSDVGASRDAGIPSSDRPAVAAPVPPVVRDEPSVVPAAPPARDESVADPPARAPEALAKEAPSSTPARPGAARPLAKKATVGVAKPKIKPDAAEGKELFNEPD